MIVGVIALLGLVGVLLLARRLPRIALEVDGGAEAISRRSIAALSQEHLRLSIHLQSLEGLEGWECHFLAVGVVVKAVIPRRILTRVCFRVLLELQSWH